jgi:hypothetical protein
MRDHAHLPIFVPPFIGSMKEKQPLHALHPIREIRNTGTQRPACTGTKGL